jgi:hypothetical protein
VVKVWRQSAPGGLWVGRGMPERDVPELLVYDDALEFEDGFAMRDGKRAAYRPPPEIHPPLRTDLAAGRCKQFWVTVDVPVSATPVVYWGALDIRGEGMPGLTLPLELRVLPWELPRPSKLYGMYDWYVSDDPDSFLYKSKRRHLAELRAMEEAGMTSLAFWAQRDRDARFMLSRFKEAGFRGPLVTLGFSGATPEELACALKASREYGIDVYFYGKDEPNNPAKIKTHLERARRARAAGGRVMTAVTVPYALRLRDPEADAYAISPGPACPLDWANLALEHTYRTYVELRAAGRMGRLAPVQTVYWQCYVEIPTLNRYNAGFHVWASGQDGAFPNVHQSYWPASPYNDRDRRTPLGKPGRVARPFCTTYPTQGAPIPTLQWESWRAGITDSRYVTLLDSEIERAEREGHRQAAGRARKALDDVLRPFRRPPGEDAPIRKLDARALLYVEPLPMETARREIVGILHRLGRPQ